MAVMTVSTEHIEITPGVCGGRPRIAGSRIRVQDIYAYHVHHGWSAGKLVEAFPTLTLAQVHAALAYYYDHREEIERAFNDDVAFGEEMRSRSDTTLARKLRELRGADRGGDPVPL